MKNISTVYLENNASSSIYYGNEGLANLCVYYWVFKTYKANIYITNDTIFSLANYEKIENMILALNAFVCQQGSVMVSMIEYLKSFWI